MSDRTDKSSSPGEQLEWDDGFKQYETEWKLKYKRLVIDDPVRELTEEQRQQLKEWSNKLIVDTEGIINSHTYGTPWVQSDLRTTLNAHTLEEAFRRSRKELPELRVSQFLDDPDNLYKLTIPPILSREEPEVMFVCSEKVFERLCLVLPDVHKHFRVFLPRKAEDEQR